MKSDEPFRILREQVDSMGMADTSLRVGTNTTNTLLLVLVRIEVRVRRLYRLNGTSTSLPVSNEGDGHRVSTEVRYNVMYSVLCRLETAM